MNKHKQDYVDLIIELSIQSILDYLVIVGEVDYE